MADERRWPGGLRASLFSRTILLASALVIVTAASLSMVLIQAVNARVEQNTVARLRDGAGYFRSALDDERRQGNVRRDP